MADKPAKVIASVETFEKGKLKKTQTVEKNTLPTKESMLYKYLYDYNCLTSYLSTAIIQEKEAK